MRMATDGDALNNKVFFDYFEFPVFARSPLDCFWKIKRITDGNKRKLRSVLYYNLLNFLFNLNLLRMNYLLKVYSFLLQRFACALSNVAGPPSPVYLDGILIEDMQFITETDLAVYFGIYSYNGKVSGTVTMDAAIEPYPERLCKHWKPQFDALKRSVDEALEKQKPADDFLACPDFVFKSSLQEKIIFALISLIFSSWIYFLIGSAVTKL
ncbi:uncharacterized protein LOC135122327 [Zophobas morio]|uniref:uncharacterized protein LOC135122327 n=1 Tax=Zophobas morio TaxID=2755281 RepID=UPI0030826D5B